MPSASPLETPALLLLLLPPATPHAWAGDQRNQRIAACPVNPVPNVSEREVIPAPAPLLVTAATKHGTQRSPSGPGLHFLSLLHAPAQQVHRCLTQQHKRLCCSAWSFLGTVEGPVLPTACSPAPLRLSIALSRGARPFKASHSLPEELPSSWASDREVCAQEQVLHTCYGVLPHAWVQGSLGYKGCRAPGQRTPSVGGSGWWDSAKHISFLSSAQRDLPSPSLTLCKLGPAETLFVAAWRVGYAEHIAGFTAGKVLVAVK